MTNSFPHQLYQTRRFTAGAPASFQISPDGGRVLFTRSRGGTDPERMLWLADAGTGQQTLVADPAKLAHSHGVPQEELARRERARERSTGVTAYSTDDAFRRVAFALSGRLWMVELDTLAAAEVATPGPVVDPRIDPTGERIAYVTSGALHVVGAGAIATPDSEHVYYGLAEFVAAEEIRRDRGFWWAPDGRRLVVARVDESMVQQWFITDPSDPAARPRAVRYPVAGTANADVSLWIVDLAGQRTEIVWDRAAYEYVAAVHWSGHGLVVVVQNRDQSSMVILSVDPETGATTRVREDRDDLWVPLTPGTPDFTASGELVWTVDDPHDTDSRRLVVGAEPVTPAGLQVRAVLGVDRDTVLFRGGDDAIEVDLWSYSRAEGLKRLTAGPGIHSGHLRGGTLVVSRTTLDTMAQYTINGHPLTSLAEAPRIAPRVRLGRAGRDRVRYALLLPSGHVPGSGRLAVLMDPYGGPAGQRVLHSRGNFLASQWFADQGFAVIVADGRGTPGRGPRSDRSIFGDKAGLALEDQIVALHTAAGENPDLDLTRVGIRGWSFGGFLAMLAVLRRPDVFHAAVSGAPVTDQRLYDTYYSERYLGHPQKNPQAYDVATLLGEAASLTRPLMLIHGFADDNVVVAHTLRMSAALLAAGRPHTVLPLSRATHMGGDSSAAANTMVLQAEFLRDALIADQRSSSSGKQA